MQQTGAPVFKPSDGCVVLIGERAWRLDADLETEAVQRYVLEPKEIMIAPQPEADHCVDAYGRTPAR